VELGAIDPHLMQDDSKFSGNGNFGFAEPASLRQPNAPSF